MVVKGVRLFVVSCSQITPGVLAFSGPHLTFCFELITSIMPPTTHPSTPLLDTPQWAGKTIALGTFPSAEADEKCARAKALTRAWRSTMRPKPTREWYALANPIEQGL